MAWKAVDRRAAVIDPNAAPLLTDGLKRKIRAFLDRYEVRRAALLPTLHVVQDTYGHVSWQAMHEVAELLGLQPSDVLDTISFYTHFWTHPKGRKVIVACRSLSCELTGAREVLSAVKQHLGIAEHETTHDRQYSLLTEECLGACEHAPCLLINEKLHKRVRPEDVPSLLADVDNDELDVPRSELFDGIRLDDSVASEGGSAPGPPATSES